MGKKSTPAPPPAPDYTAAAERTAQGNLEAQTRADWANRPNQFTPWGSLTWESEQVTDPATGLPVTRWTQHTILDPRSQRALDDQFAIQEGMSSAAKGLLGRASSTFDMPFDSSGLPRIGEMSPYGLGDYVNLDLSGLPSLQGFDASQLYSMDPSMLSAYREFNPTGMPELRAGLDTSQLSNLPDAGFGAVQQVQDAMLSRLRPSLDRRRENEIARLKAQGLEEGSRAWQTAMTNLNEAENDAEMQALLRAANVYGDIFNRSMAARQQGVGEQLADANLRSRARGQLFGEQDRAAVLANALRGQQFSEQLARRQQGLGEQAMGAEIASANRGQLFGERESAASLANATRSQLFGERSSMLDQNARLRAQGLSERAWERSLPLNELNALLSGHHVSSPTFSGFATSQNVGGPDYLGASRAQYGDALSAYNANLASRANRFGGLMGLAGRLGGAFFGPIGSAAGSAFGRWLGL